MQETNIHLENVLLAERLNAFQLGQVDTLQKEDIEIEAGSASLNFFMEKLTAWEKSGVEATPQEIEEQITYFREHLWPRMKEIGDIPEHRNPFPDYLSLKKSDLDQIKRRIAYLANQQERILGKHAREYQRLTYASYLLISMMTNQGKENPSRGIVKNQRTG